MEFENNFNLEWMNEKVEAMYENNWMYKVICFLLLKPKKKLTYKELYLLIRGVNEKRIGNKKADAFAISEIFKIYYYNNKTLPNIEEKQ